MSACDHLVMDGAYEELAQGADTLRIRAASQAGLLLRTQLGPPLFQLHLPRVTVPATAPRAAHRWISTLLVQGSRGQGVLPHTLSTNHAFHQLCVRY